MFVIIWGCITLHMKVGFAEIASKIINRLVFMQNIIRVVQEN